MRCSTCGTDNTPDSRFCGGCGAKMFPSEPPRPVVAPTAKISDDAPFPQSIPPNTMNAPTYRAGYSSGPAAMPPPVQQTPASIPPVPSGYVTPPSIQRSARQPSSVPPMHGSGPNASPPAASQRRYAEPSMSMPEVPPRSRVGLIVLVLLVDIALAVSGALLLAKGLAKVEPALPAPPPPTPTAKDPKAGSAKLDGSASSPVVVKQADLPATLPKPVDDPPPAPEPKADPKHTTKHDKVTPPPHVDAKKLEPDAKPDVKPDLKPDPPARVDSVPAIDTNKALKNEVDLQTSRSKVDFDDCYNDLGGLDGKIHGQLTVAFRVLTDGHVSNVETVSNQTGSKELASCITGTIGHWSFAAHPAAATNFMRTFAYP